MRAGTDSLRRVAAPVHQIGRGLVIRRRNNLGRVDCLILLSISARLEHPFRVRLVEKDDVILLQVLRARVLSYLLGAQVIARVLPYQPLVDTLAAVEVPGHFAVEACHGLVEKCAVDCAVLLQLRRILKYLLLTRRNGRAAFQAAPDNFVPAKVARFLRGLGPCQLLSGLKQFSRHSQLQRPLNRIESLALLVGERSQGRVRAFEH